MERLFITVEPLLNGMSVGGEELHGNGNATHARVGEYTRDDTIGETTECIDNGMVFVRKPTEEIIKRLLFDDVGGVIDLHLA